LDDIGKVFESEPGAVVVPNPELKPEYAWNGEIGTSRVFGRWIKMDLTAYYTWLDNAFARRDFQYNGQDSILYDGEMSQVQAIQNLSHAYVLGIQAALDVRFGKGFGLNSILNIQHGMEETEDFTLYPLQHAAPLFGSSHFVYERKNLKADLYLLYNGKMEFEDLPLSERNDASPYAKDVDGNPFVPGWYTLNFKIAWYINKNLSVTTGVENMTDQLYRTYASGISAPGRNFVVALRVKI
jgi:hemoglobin/transferrin/lactoferrin receptor protein